jgi:O-acetyl-ADP-ribose deacetylase (regulator of RNase III)
MEAQILSGNIVPANTEVIVINTLDIVNQKAFASVAFPVIGTGSGGCSRRAALEIMQNEFSNITSRADVTTIAFEK